jgi:GH15 family glucan-1,4-alpha-glucosidase
VGIRSFFLKKLAEHYGLTKALERIEASFNLGESAEIAIPKEIAAFSIDFASRGLLNMFAIQCNLDWILPYWVDRQYDEAGTSYVPGTVLSTNLTHRNWTAIGALDSEREPIVDPTGLLTPWYDSWSTDFWVGKNEYLIVPSKNDEVYQYLVKQLPIVVSQFVKKDLRIRTKAFVHTYKGEEIVSHSISLENLETKDVSVSLFVNIRPYNPEGISIIHEICYVEKENIFRVNGNDALFLLKKPDRVFCSNQAGGDTSWEAFSERKREMISCKHGLASAFAEYRLGLAAGEVKEIEVRAMTTPKPSSAINREVINELSYQEIKRQVISEWEERLSKSIYIRLPYQKMQNSFNGNKAHLYLFIDGTSITPGPYTYHHEWFRDDAYMLTALDKMGFCEEAERILRNYPERQRSDGYFLSQEGEWDSNGQALWTYYQHFLYTRKRDFLENIYESAYYGYLWIKKKRVKETGLLPPGYSAEHFGPNDTFYWDNFWALAGLKGFYSIAEELGRKKVVRQVQNEIADYEKAVFSSLQSLQKKFSFPLIPSSPNRDIDSSIVGSIVALYPLRLVPPRDEKMTGTLQVLRKKYQQNQAFFHRVIHSGYNVYLTLQIAECYLFRRSSRLLPIAQWVMDTISGTGSFPEAIHPVTGGGCMGDGHHGWACAELLHLIRNILFFEEENGLVITPVMYHRWMEAGETIEVDKAPSYFGTIHFIIESKSDRVILRLDNLYSYPPAFIEFSIPFFIKKVLVDEKEIEINKASTFRFDPFAREVIVYR